MPDGHPAETVARLAVRAAGSAPRCGQTRVVAIDGPSGSGKSTLAAQLAEATRAPVLHMDDIYPGWDGLADSIRLVVRDVLEPLAHGERAAYRRWDWTHDRPGKQIEVPPVPLLILEGAGASVGPAGDYAAVRVWVDADEASRRARGIGRDPGFEPHWDRWASQESQLFAADRTRDRADVILRTDQARG